MAPMNRLEIHLQVIAEFFRGIQMDPPSQLRKSGGQHRAQPVHRLLHVAGRFNFHQLADAFYNLRLLFTKITELLGRLGDTHCQIGRGRGMFPARRPTRAIKYNLRA